MSSATPNPSSPVRRGQRRARVGEPAAIGFENFHRAVVPDGRQTGKDEIFPLVLERALQNFHFTLAATAAAAAARRDMIAVSLQKREKIFPFFALQFARIAARENFYDHFFASVR